MLNNYNYANYTISLKELVENGADIFNFEYTTNESKEELERRFLNKYWFKEIGYETYSMWHFKFKEQWLNRLKHYNQLFDNYKDIDPLLDYERITNYIGNELSKNKEDTKGESTGVGSSTGSATNKQVQKDTPIGRYDESDYVSYVGDDKSDNTSSTESESKTITELLKDLQRDMTHEETEKIMTGSMLKRLNHYINNYVDLIERFLNEFNNLFMRIF